VRGAISKLALAGRLVQVFFSRDEYFLHCRDSARTRVDLKREVDEGKPSLTMIDEGEPKVNLTH
jgi:hypothetical protein